VCDVQDDPRGRPGAVEREHAEGRAGADADGELRPPLERPDEPDVSVAMLPTDSGSEPERRIGHVVRAAAAGLGPTVIARASRTTVRMRRIGTSSFLAS
jgi:hypothetical protein